MAYLCEIEPFSFMPSYAFEVVQTIAGHPFTCMYPKNWAYSPGLKGASRVVIREYPDEATARKQAVIHEQELATAEPSEIWAEFCPKEFRNNCRGGTDVRFIRLANPNTWSLFMAVAESTAFHWNIPSRRC